MPVVIMEAVEKERLTQADALTRYVFRSPAQGDLQIVANDTNLYELGDTVGVALVGTKLPGLQIKPRKVFGIPSSGMACGPVTGTLDDDVSEAFDADMPARSWTVTVEVTVEASYEEDAGAEGLKKARGSGRVLSAVPA